MEINQWVRIQLMGGFKWRSYLIWLHYLYIRFNFQSLRERRLCETVGIRKKKTEEILARKRQTTEWVYTGICYSCTSKHSYLISSLNFQWTISQSWGNMHWTASRSLWSGEADVPFIWGEQQPRRHRRLATCHIQWSEEGELINAIIDWKRMNEMLMKCRFVQFRAFFMATKSTARTVDLFAVLELFKQIIYLNR